MEVDKAQLTDLPEIVEQLQERPERFIVYCDDLSFEQGEGAYKALKTVLDGSLSDQADNVLVTVRAGRIRSWTGIKTESRSWMGRCGSDSCA